MGVEFAQRYYHDRLRRKDQPAPLQRLVDRCAQRAKAGFPRDRVLVGRTRYANGEATFEQLLCEEALTPEVQDRYKKEAAACGENSARRESSLKAIKAMRKGVYDRVRSWLTEPGCSPRVQRCARWWREVLPDP